jgi:hypothetical protein
VPPPHASIEKIYTLLGSSFFRSYGGNLPSSLTIVLPIALVFSTCPPVSVWGTGTVLTHCWAFLGSMGSMTSPVAARHHVSEFTAQLSSDPPTRLPGDNHRSGSSTLLRPPPATRKSIAGIVRRQPPGLHYWAWREHGSTGISTSYASTTPFGLALAPDLPWED